VSIAPDESSFLSWLSPKSATQMFVPSNRIPPKCVKPVDTVVTDAQHVSMIDTDPLLLAVQILVPSVVRPDGLVPRPDAHTLTTPAAEVGSMQ